MDARKAQIREHQEAVDELDLSIERQKGELGRVLLEKEKAPAAELEKAAGEAGKTKSGLASLEAQRKSLKAALDGKIAAVDRIEALKGAREDYKRSRESLLLEIGRKGWNLFDQGSLDEKDFRPYFTEVIERAREIEERERKIRDFDAEKERAGLMKRFSVSAKITLIRTQIRRLQGAMDELFVTAGEALLSSGKTEAIPDEEMKRSISRLKDMEEREEEREAELKKLEGELSGFDEKIEENCEGTAPERRMKSLDEELSSLQERHYEKLRLLGEEYFSLPEKPEKEDKEIKLILERISDLETQKGKHQEEIHVLQAKLEKDELEGQIKKKEDSISKLEQRVKEEKKEIKTLKEGIAYDKNRLSDLDAIIGGTSE